MEEREGSPEFEKNSPLGPTDFRSAESISIKELLYHFSSFLSHLFSSITPSYESGEERPVRNLRSTLQKKSRSERDYFASLPHPFCAQDYKLSAPLLANPYLQKLEGEIRSLSSSLDEIQQEMIGILGDYSLALGLKKSKAPKKIYNSHLRTFSIYQEKRVKLRSILYDKMLERDSFLQRGVISLQREQEEMRKWSIVNSKSRDVLPFLFLILLLVVLVFWVFFGDWKRMLDSIELDMATFRFQMFFKGFTCIVVGLGFTLVFLKWYAFSSIGFHIFGCVWSLLLSLSFIVFYKVFEGEEWAQVEVEIDDFLLGIGGMLATAITLSILLGRVEAKGIVIISTVEVMC